MFILNEAIRNSKCGLLTHLYSWGNFPEGVHIVPHAESGINELDNGLLMRADLHHLFDDGLLSIDSETRNIELDDRLQNTSYWQFNRTQLRLRSNGTQISSKYLRQRVK